MLLVQGHQKVLVLLATNPGKGGLTQLWDRALFAKAACCPGWKEDNFV